MKKRILLLIIYKALYGAVTGQYTYHPVGGPFSFSAKAGAHFTTALNAAGNPSLIPNIKNIQVAFYAEKKYMTDINELLITVCAPFSDNGVSLMFKHFGNSFFNENIMGLGYGKKIGALNAGILFQHLRLKIAGAESVSIIRAGIATSYKVDENVFVGFTIMNPDLFAKTKGAKLHAASSFCLMLGWEATTDVYTGLEFFKGEGQPLSLIFVLQYRIKENFACALNWNTFNHQPFASLSWVQQHVEIEAGCSYHPILGSSPSITIIYKKTTDK